MWRDVHTRRILRGVASAAPRRDAHRHRPVRRAAATAALAALVLWGCDDADPAPAATTAPESSAPTTNLPSPAALENADGEVTTALGTFPLQVLECRLDPDDPIAVVAETEDGAARLELGGDAAAATVTFTLDHGDGDPVVWTVTSAAPEIDDATLAYEGPSMVTGLTVAETAIAVTISC